MLKDLMDKRDKTSIAKLCDQFSKDEINSLRGRLEKVLPKEISVRLQFPDVEKMKTEVVTERIQ